MIFRSACSSKEFCKCISNSDGCAMQDNIHFSLLTHLVTGRKKRWLDTYSMPFSDKCPVQGLVSQFEFVSHVGVTTGNMSTDPSCVWDSETRYSCGHRADRFINIDTTRHLVNFSRKWFALGFAKYSGVETVWACSISWSHPKSHWVQYEKSVRASMRSNICFCPPGKCG